MSLFAGIVNLLRANDTKGVAATVTYAAAPGIFVGTSGC